MLEIEDFVPPDPAPDSDLEYYRDGSWRAYWQTVDDIKKPGPVRLDRGAFLPNPDEVSLRIGMMRWLKHKGFNDLFVSSVMIHNSPTFERACEMIDRHGPIETYKRCLPFLQS